MWQADTWDPKTIDRELGWAQDLGFTSVRVFLHDIAWKTDRAGLLKRMEQFLSMADKHKIGVMFVLFDSVWDPYPKAGKQREPYPHRHNSGWVQSPGQDILMDPVKQDELKAYVQDVIGHFRNDQRVQVWDLFNEPDNLVPQYKNVLLPGKVEFALQLLRKTFGWARDNFIGATPQVNGWGEDWVAFWRDRRVHAQLRFAAHNRLPSKMIDRGERLLADSAAFFGNYAPAKSLLHGDLWTGNASALADGTPVVFDPAVYVGDREADVAMTELFGGFPREFKAAYASEWALDPGYRTRRDFYNLYQILNHANLFGGSYVRQGEQTIEKLLSEIR